MGDANVHEGYCELSIFILERCEINVGLVFLEI